jgi:cysteine-rich repeat protein
VCYQNICIETCRNGAGCDTGYLCNNDQVCVGSLCGNRVLNSGEQCDDGNRNDTDGCDRDCFIERSGGRCGDGILQGARGEQCDDGNTISNDGCNAVCVREGTFVAGLSVCGDGIVGENEECDDANLRDFDGCTSVCSLEVGSCGDGVVQRALGEQCEPRLHDSSLPYGCDAARCRFVSSECGNGVVNIGEGCDKGNMNSNMANQQCRLDCSMARCGDGVVDDMNGEQCDDGNLLRGDGCSSMCSIEYGAFTAFNPLSTNGQNPVRLPLATLTQQSRGPVGNTGPAVVIMIAAGAAGGIGFVRRRR